MKNKGGKVSPEFAFMHGQTNIQAKNSLKVKGNVSFQLQIKFWPVWLAIFRKERERGICNINEF